MNVLRAASGQEQDVRSVSGPSSYPTGGFSVRADIGRVSEAITQGDSVDNGYVVTAINDSNALVVQAYDKAAGGEIAGGTDLSDDSITYFANRL
jgi:hypothetical protein